MNQSLGIVMDPIQTINFKKDTSLGLLLAAQRKGFRLYFIAQGDLYLENGLPMASAAPLEVFNDPACWYKLGEPQTIHLESLDVILMRKDPPFDSEFIYSTYILEAAEQRGSLVVNKPQSLRDCNEKVFATQFTDCTPPLLVSRDQKRLKAFLQTHGDVVYKPLEGMGGTSIFRVKDGDQNVNVILEVLTDYSKTTVMAQKYVPEIKDGDKRILVVNGEVIPYCLARLPTGNDFRGNLAAGGRGVVQPISDSDRRIAERIAPELVARGLLFVGLDVIGSYLTEVNVTSPTCLREIEAETGLDIAGKLIDAIMEKLAS